MSGHTASPTNQTHAIALLARALWETSGTYDLSTHYLEISLPRSAIAVFEKTELATMRDAYIDQCVAKKDHLLVLIITSESKSGADFMAMALPMDVKS